LTSAGDGNEDERLELLRAHRKQVRVQLATMAAYLDARPVTPAVNIVRRVANMLCAPLSDGAKTAITDAPNYWSSVRMSSTLTLTWTVCRPIFSRRALITCFWMLWATSWTGSPY
jgi:hypothetical protein